MVARTGQTWGCVVSLLCVACVVPVGGVAFYPDGTVLDDLPSAVTDSGAWCANTVNLFSLAGTATCTISAGGAFTATPVDLFDYGLDTLLPGEATIQSITVDIGVAAAANNNRFRVLSLQLLNNVGNPFGTAMGPSSNFPVSAHVETFTGDLAAWGVPTLTSSVAQSSNFGVRLVLEKTTGGGTSIALEYVTLTISYGFLGRVDSLAPSQGPAGTNVTVTGGHYIDIATLGCVFGTNVVPATRLSASSVFCLAPDLRPGTDVDVFFTYDRTSDSSSWSTTSQMFTFTRGDGSVPLPRWVWAVVAIMMSAGVGGASLVILRRGAFDPNLVDGKRIVLPDNLKCPKVHFKDAFGQERDKQFTETYAAEVRKALAPLGDLLIKHPDVAANLFAKLVAREPPNIPVGPAFTALFDSEKCVEVLLDEVCKSEVAQTEQANELFRAANPSTKLMASYALIYGRSALFKVLAPPMYRMLTDENLQLEVDENKIKKSRSASGKEALAEANEDDDDQDVEVNQWALNLVSQSFLSSIIRSSATTPPEIKAICRAIYSSCNEKFPDRSLQLIGGFMFLRYFVPAVINPAQIGFTNKKTERLRYAVLVGKVLQTLANDNTFGLKEAYMAKSNTFIEANRQKIRRYFEELVAEPRRLSVAGRRPSLVADTPVVKSPSSTSKFPKGSYEFSLHLVATLLQELDPSDVKQAVAHLDMDQGTEVVNKLLELVSSIPEMRIARARSRSRSRSRSGTGGGGSGGDNSKRRSSSASSKGARTTSKA